MLLYCRRMEDRRTVRCSDWSVERFRLGCTSYNDVIWERISWNKKLVLIKQTSHFEFYHSDVLTSSNHRSCQINQNWNLTTTTLTRPVPSLFNTKQRPPSDRTRGTFILFLQFIIYSGTELLKRSDRRSSVCGSTAHNIRRHVAAVMRPQGHQQTKLLFKGS